MDCRYLLQVSRHVQTTKIDLNLLLNLLQNRRIYDRRSSVIYLRWSWIPTLVAWTPLNSFTLPTGHLRPLLVTIVWTQSPLHSFSQETELGQTVHTSDTYPRSEKGSIRYFIQRRGRTTKTRIKRRSASSQRYVFMKARPSLDRSTN